MPDALDFRVSGFCEVFTELHKGRVVYGRLQTIPTKCARNKMSNDPKPFCSDDRDGKDGKSYIYSNNVRGCTYVRNQNVSMHGINMMIMLAMMICLLFKQCASMHVSAQPM